MQGTVLTSVPGDMFTQLQGNLSFPAERKLRIARCPPQQVL